MRTSRALLACFCLSQIAAYARAAEPEPRAALLLDEDEDHPDKKARWLAEKAARTFTASPAPAALPRYPLSLHNMWTDEILPLDEDTPDTRAQASFDLLVRCHYTQVATAMAPRLLGILRKAAATFHAPLVEIVSGYRAPKYQLMLRKKGHEVARDSAHPRGEAVDFRLPEVRTQALLAFVRKQRLGGVGYYPVSRFVHADVGPVRYWKGN